MATTHVVVVDLGTYCDNSLAIEALVQIAAAAPGVRHDYVTNDRTDVGRLTGLNVAVHRYHMPSFVVHDKDLRAADPQYSMVFWGLQHPIDAVDSILLMNQIARAVERCCTASTTLLVAYPALPFVAYVKPSRLGRLRSVCVLYYAPAFPNADVPWLFDSLIKDAKYRAYRNSSEFNKVSHDGFLSRIAFSARMSTERFVELYAGFKHVACWIPGAARPVRPLYGEVVVARPLLPGSDAPLPEALEELGRRYEKSVLVTFGSYASASELRGVRERLLAPDGALVRWATENDAVVLVHSLLEERWSSDRIVTVRGFVPYNTLLARFRARVELVVFTGSLCLQNTCVANRRPMMYAPLLVEQFFWAKNYRHFTGLPFVDYRSPDAFFRTLDVDRFVRAPRRYLAEAHRSVHDRSLPTLAEAVL